MSRVLKFRAWDEKNKQFADYEDIEECLSCQSRDGWKSSDGMGCCFGINAVETLADCIIEQYTELKDKNGKEIYEGDILDTPGGRCLCIWNGDGWTYQFKVHRTDWFDIVKDFHKNSEVIGNIHENKELWGESI